MMPTFEFKCPTGHTVSKKFRISDLPPTVLCEVCGQEGQVQIQGVPFHIN